MRFEVPQFIEIEDKIFGPLTWKQFIYIAGGGGFAIVCFFVLPFILFVFFAIPVGALAAALAFYPVNNRPFSIFLESAYRYFSGNRLYLWRRNGEFESPEYAENSEAALFPQSNQRYTPPQNQNRLNSLSRQLELNALEKD
jgi:hypothetical protein